MRSWRFMRIMWLPTASSARRVSTPTAKGNGRSMKMVTGHSPIYVPRGTVARARLHARYVLRGSFKAKQGGIGQPARAVLRGDSETERLVRSQRKRPVLIAPRADTIRLSVTIRTASCARQVCTAMLLGAEGNGSTKLQEVRISATLVPAEGVRRASTLPRPEGPCLV